MGKKKTEQMFFSARRAGRSEISHSGRGILRAGGSSARTGLIRDHAGKRNQDNRGSMNPETGVRETRNRLSFTMRGRVD